MNDGMIHTAISSLRAYAKWLSHGGRKYAMPGCDTNVAELTRSIRLAIVSLSCTMDASEMAKVAELAKFGAYVRKDREGAKSATELGRIARRLEKCQGTER